MWKIGFASVEERERYFMAMVSLNGRHCGVLT